MKLQQTLTALNSKTTFYQDQMNYYDTYIKTCLDNLNRKWVIDTFHGVGDNFTLFCRGVMCVFCVFRNSRRSIKVDSKGDDKGSKKWKPQSLKYTAARLHEKGVILEIEGLQVNQWVELLNTKYLLLLHQRFVFPLQQGCPLQGVSLCEDVLHRCSWPLLCPLFCVWVKILNQQVIRVL